MSKKKSDTGFEQKLSRLEQIASLLEDSEIGLEDSIILFEEGVKLSRECLSMLEKAELKVTVLKKELKAVNNKDDE